MVTFDFGAGFLPPVNNAPVINTGKGGRTYPIKFQLPKPDGTFYSSLSLVSSITVQQVVCGSFGTALTDPLETTATGGTTLRYDSGVNQYIYNWQTPGPGCYLLTVNLGDGTQHQAEFSLN